MCELNWTELCFYFEMELTWVDSIEDYFDHARFAFVVQNQIERFFQISN